MQNLPIASDVVEAGHLAEREGDLERALARYGEALAVVPAEQEPGRAAEILRAIARVYHKRGDYLDALNASERSLEHAERSGKPEHVVAALNAVAISAQYRGKLDRAEEMYTRAAELAENTGQTALAAMVNQNVATLASIRGDTATALARYRRALDEFRRNGDRVSAPYVLTNMALAHAELGDWPAAQAALNEAHQLAQETGDLDQMAMIRLNKGDLCVRLHQFDEAREHCDRAFELYTRLESKSGLAETYKCYGLLYKESGKPALAEAHLLMVVQLAQECEDPLLEAEAEYERALAYLGEGRNRDVLQALSRAQRLFNELRATRQVADIEQRLDRLQETYLQVVRAWGESIEAKDNYTAGHCGRVADYTCLLAEAAGFAGRDLVWIRMGAFLHDVGKTAVPEAVLNKPGKLDDAEWAVMKTHTTVGDQIVGELNFPFDIRPIVRNHHERWDGSGYPDGLKGEAIPVTARILCVADIYDALTTTRSYRPSFSHDEAIKIMDGLSGQGVDPNLYRLFKEKVLGAAPAVAGSR